MIELRRALFHTPYRVAKERRRIRVVTADWVVEPDLLHILTRIACIPTLGNMEVRFTPEEEARLAKMATQEGVQPEELVKDAALRLLKEDMRFRVAVRKGVEQADRGELIDEEEMDARVKRMFQP